MHVSSNIVQHEGMRAMQTAAPAAGTHHWHVRNAAHCDVQLHDPAALLSILPQHALRPYVEAVARDR